MSFVTIELNEQELELYKEKMAIYYDELHIVQGYNQGGNMYKLNN